MLYNPYYNINPFGGYPVSVYVPYPYDSTSPYSAYLIAATASALYR